MATGAQYMPRAATVAYAAAMDSGETLTEPSVNEGMLSAESWLPSRLSKDVPSARVRPMLAAVFTTLQRPTFCSSSAKYTLTDWTVPGCTTASVSALWPGFQYLLLPGST